MPSSPVLWGLSLLLLFWAVGAYQRLLRLRAAAHQAFGALDAYLVRQQALLAECEAAHAQASGAPAAALAALQAASIQWGAALALARARPLSPEAVATLGAGQRTLVAAWQALLRAREDEDGPAAIASWRQRWDTCQAHNGLAQQQFNDAVTQYNAAIAQWPARLLALLLGLRPGACV